MGTGQVTEGRNRVYGQYVSVEVKQLRAEIW